MKHDKLIHKDEFRLRVLLTNACNKDCHFCLNDFQPKEPKQYADMMDLMDCIRAYGSFMKYINKESIITFSGGEPGIYPHLDSILKIAKYRCDTVKVVTNGTAFHQDRIPFVDKWHFGVTERSLIPMDAQQYTHRIVVQYVVKDTDDEKDINHLVEFYRMAKIHVKLFVDFHSKNKYKLQALIYNVYKNFAITDVSTRFTGKQINRGPACDGCKKECVTLKALWYFPDGTSSTCPQGMVEKYDDYSWDETVEKAYKAHKYSKKKGS